VFEVIITKPHRPFIASTQAETVPLSKRRGESRKMGVKRKEEERGGREGNGLAPDVKS